MGDQGRDQQVEQPGENHQQTGRRTFLAAELVGPTGAGAGLLQRKPGAPGARLGKTSGWVHRAHLRHNAVRMLGGVEYLKIDERGLLIRVDGEERWLEVDNVVICAGQEPLRELQISQAAESLRFHLIGGARVAACNRRCAPGPTAKPCARR